MDQDSSDGKRKSRRGDVRSGFLCGSLFYAAIFATYVITKQLNSASPLDTPKSPPTAGEDSRELLADLSSSPAPAATTTPASAVGGAQACAPQAHVPPPPAWSVPPLPGERVPLVYEVATITGRPPLLCRADMGDASDDAVWGEGCPHPSFFVADPPKDAGAPYAYIREAEDVMRDVFVAVLTSPGRALNGRGRAATDATEPDSRLNYFACKPSPVTRPYFCAGPLLDEEKGGRYERSGLWVVDVGANVGYFPLLAASLGFPALSIDEQPHCAALVETAAQASGLTGLVRSRTLRLAATPGGVLRVPPRGCVGSSTLPALKAPSPADLWRHFTAVATEGVAALGREDKDRPAATPLAEAPAWTARVPVPVTSLDTLLLDELWGEGGASEQQPQQQPPPVVLLLKVRARLLCKGRGAAARRPGAQGACTPGGQGEGGASGRSDAPSCCAQIDVRGRQRGVLAGASRLIAQRRVLNVLIEVNKLHSAAALRWEEEARKAYADNEEGGAEQAWPENDAPLSDTDNDAATQDLIALVQVGGGPH